MSQKQRVLNRLKQGPCTNMEFIYGMRIPRAGARLFEINQAHIRAFGCPLVKKRPGPKPNIEIWFLANDLASEK